MPWGQKTPCPALRLPECLCCLVLSDKIPNGLEQHVLLGSSQIDPELLERDDDLIARVVVAADVQLRLATRFRGGALRLYGWFTDPYRFWGRRMFLAYGGKQ